MKMHDDLLDWSSMPMAKKNSDIGQDTAKLAKLDSAVTGVRSMLIVVHDFPDPDALASAFVFAHLLRQRYKIRSVIAHGGHISRAENRAMVQQLRLKLWPIEKIRWRRNMAVTMLDTQPFFGNHSLPADVRPLVVIDHHPTRVEPQCPVVDIRTDYGTCATILLEYLNAAQIPITADIATAIIYAIRSETMELARDAAWADTKAYLELFPKASMRKLYKITRPRLPHAYFLILKRALTRAKVFRHIVHVHLGVVDSPEYVSLAAESLLRHEFIGWTLATGRFNNQLFLSIRSNHPKAHAGRVLAKVVGKYGSAGGHKAMAGGYVLMSRYDGIKWEAVEERIANRFVRKLGYKIESGWRPLLEPDESEPESRDAGWPHQKGG